MSSLVYALLWYTACPGMQAPATPVLAKLLARACYMFESDGRIAFIGTYLLANGSAQRE